MQHIQLLLHGERCEAELASTELEPQLQVGHASLHIAADEGLKQPPHRVPDGHGVHGGGLERGRQLQVDGLNMHEQLRLGHCRGNDGLLSVAPTAQAGVDEGRFRDRVIEIRELLTRVVELHGREPALGLFKQRPAAEWRIARQRRKGFELGQIKHEQLEPTIVRQMHREDGLRHQDAEDVLLVFVLLHQTLHRCSPARRVCALGVLARCEVLAEALACEFVEALDVVGEALVARVANELDGFHPVRPQVSKALPQDVEPHLHAEVILPRWHLLACEDRFEEGVGGHAGLVLTLDEVLEGLDADALVGFGLRPLAERCPCKAVGAATLADRDVVEILGAESHGAARHLQRDIRQREALGEVRGREDQVRYVVRQSHEAQGALLRPRIAQDLAQVRELLPMAP
mmetsp:Transcript_14901/g.42965  ORF Transcript_14901/g.42965 Transcript_14901/m.42965 type:complete len:402 (+) Transcript_14901:440-1645(+)